MLKIATLYFFSNKPFSKTLYWISKFLLILICKKIPLSIYCVTLLIKFLILCFTKAFIYLEKRYFIQLKKYLKGDKRFSKSYLKQNSFIKATNASLLEKDKNLSFSKSLFNICF